MTRGAQRRLLSRARIGSAEIGAKCPCRVMYESHSPIGIRDGGRLRPTLSLTSPRGRQDSERSGLALVVLSMGEGTFGRGPGHVGGSR